MTNDSAKHLTLGSSLPAEEPSGHLFTTPLTCGTILYNLSTDQIVEANEIAAQEIGLSRVELLATPGRNLWGEEGGEIIQRIYPRMQMTDKTILWGQPLPLNRRGGKNSWGLASFTILNCEPGVVRIYLENPAPELPRHPSGQLPLRSFAGHALQGSMWGFDIKRRRFHYGNENTSIYGPDGLPGNSGLTTQELLAKIHPNDATQIVYRWRQLITRGIHARSRYRIMDDSGGWRWIYSAVQGIVNDHLGEPSFAFGINLDLTEDLGAERNHLEIQSRLLLFFENADIGMAMADASGVLTSVNPAMAVLFGRNREDFEDRSLAAFLPEKDRNEFNACLARLATGRHRRELYECRLERPDGREVWVKITVTMANAGLDPKSQLILLIEDVTALRANHEKLVFEATHDALTGLINHGTVLTRLDEHIQLALRQEQPLSFAMVDIDYFKLVNDRHGHQAGDRVLRKFAKILDATIRDTDLAGRYGGEEFCIVFPGTPPEGAAEAMERLLERFRTEEFTAPGTGDFKVTATVGIASLAQFGNFRDLIDGADVALYVGKNAGRDRVVISNGGGEERTVACREVEE